MIRGGDQAWQSEFLEQYLSIYNQTACGLGQMLSLHVHRNLAVRQLRQSSEILTVAGCNIVGVTPS